MAQPKARIPDHDNERLKQALGDTTVDDFLSGVIYNLLEEDIDAEYYEAVAQVRELHGEVAEIDGQIERLDDRIAELQERREELATERDKKQERIEELEEDLVDTSASAGSGAETTVDEVAYELLVDVAHDEIGTNGVTAGEEAVQQAAVRAGVDPDEVIEAMRQVADPATDGERVEYVEAPLERGFVTSDQRVQERLEDTEFDRVRQAVAEEVLDEADVEWGAVPEQEFGT